MFDHIKEIEMITNQKPTIIFETPGFLLNDNQEKILVVFETVGGEKILWSMAPGQLLPFRVKKLLEADTTTRLFICW
ncbi:MAG: hypothetical protein WCI71_02140 [Bacteroidota bacterium]